jgi:prepilin-type N-terminal cleavage/methylation domain-containing protein/prepilin-type processing-associated H-X9-DG protein
MTRARKGLTLLEVLVVLAIITVLLALGVPAVMKARTAADRVGCANNLKQIGVALQNYHDSHSLLPSGIASDRPDQLFPYMSWLTQLLPHLDDGTLWQTTVAAYQADPWPFDNPPHVGFGTPIKVFACPADGRMLDTHEVLSGYQPALTSYVGVLGIAWNDTRGVLFQDSQTRLSDITDGTSNTVVVGERPPSTDFRYGWWYAGYGQAGTGSTDMLLGVNERYLGGGSAYACPPGPYQFQPGDVANECDLFHFYSLHPGGAHFIFGDGSVRFLAYRAAPVLPALATRAGGEVVIQEY